MPFSYSTMRQRWLNGQVVAEYNVIIMDYFPGLMLLAREREKEQRKRSMDIPPVLFLQCKGQRQHEEKEEHHDRAQLSALGGCRFAEVPIIFVERRQGQSKLSSGVIMESIVMPWRLKLRAARH